MDKKEIDNILNEILKHWNKPVGVGLEEDGKSTLYKTFITTKKLFNKLPNTVKTMKVFVPAKESHFYDVEKFKSGDFQDNNELLIDVNVSLADIMVNLEEQANIFKETSYFRSRWWGSPLNLQGQIKSVLLKLKKKVTSVYYDDVEKQVTLGGRRKQRKTRRKRTRRRKRTGKRKQRKTRRKRTHKRKRTGKRKQRKSRR